uniref:Uncharacterized protein n=1 Tax=Anopheles farauti TaxID=69004 RepID=A0A182Q0N7_9DIPT
MDRGSQQFADVRWDMRLGGGRRHRHHVRHLVALAERVLDALLLHFLLLVGITVRFDGTVRRFPQILRLVLHTLLLLLLLLLLVIMVMMMMMMVPLSAAIVGGGVQRVDRVTGRGAALVLRLEVLDELKLQELLLLEREQGRLEDGQILHHRLVVHVVGQCVRPIAFWNACIDIPGAAAAAGAAGGKPKALAAAAAAAGLKSTGESVPPVGPFFEVAAAAAAAAAARAAVAAAAGPPRAAAAAAAAAMFDGSTSSRPSSSLTLSREWGLLRSQSAFLSLAPASAPSCSSPSCSLAARSFREPTAGELVGRTRVGNDGSPASQQPPHGLLRCALAKGERDGRRSVVLFPPPESDTETIS